MSVTPLAMIAGAVCAPMPVALIALTGLVTLIVPPPVAERAVPFEVVTIWSVAEASLFATMPAVAGWGVVSLPAPNE